MTEEANKIFVGGIYWDDEKIEELIRNHTNQNVEAAKSLRESLVLIQKYKEENKRLRETLEGLESLQYQTPNNREAAYNKGVLDCINRFKKALSSGGE